MREINSSEIQEAVKKLAIEAGVSLKGKDISRVLEAVILEHGQPEMTTCDTVCELVPES